MPGASFVEPTRGIVAQTKPLLTVADTNYARKGAGTCKLMD